MRNTYLHLIACLLLLTASGSWSLGQSGAKPDTLFNKPYVDLEEWRDKPVRHYYVHGGFTGTDTRFSFYFPPKEQYQGRFFQYITPVPDNENLSQGATGEGDKVGFSIASGAYFVETNGGGKAAMPGFGADASIRAYRANAAAANYSRVIAAKQYGGSRPYGYAFGGSGGAYRTIGSIENTQGVWDGVVPYVIGSPMALPNVFTVRMHAMRVLQDKFPQIVDALEPGGSGDMYADLNQEEKEALHEVTKMGFPSKAWFNYKAMGIHAFTAIYPGMLIVDKKYFDDFWTVPGYLGANPPASLLKGRIQQVSKIKLLIPEDQAIKLGLMQGPLPGEAHGSADAAWKALGEKDGTMPVAFQLDNLLPTVQFLGGDLLIKSGAAAGKSLLLTHLSGDKVMLASNDLTVLASIKPGDEVQVDNSNFLAAQTYHRHQVPKKDYPVWDQFRDAEGKPLYPQRPMILGPLFTQGATGSLPKGKFNGKMIVLESLWDSEAYPWQADWYRSKVKETLGDSTDNNFRLWFTDHANHADFVRPGDPTHLVSYLGVLQQALRDLSAWVEKGVAPPANTTYKLVDGQVVVPASASERKGIQPVVTLKANGSERATVQAGKPVTFAADIEVPPNTGKVVSAAWDFEGAGTFPVAALVTPSDKSGSTVKVKTTHAFANPGTYFATLRATSQRQGDAKTPYARINNLGRVRVVVK
ncbi:PKD domain-containing protein [Spirosoma flavum]|uniref:PKD domain-containing protein n=1 Tax=Spirosoma flavum TaxID=2048557 RepID=A0ABW6AKQ6_9BACT